MMSNERTGWKRTTASLSVGQVVAWGILHYSFAVYLPQMRDELGWSLATLSGGFAAATVVAGISAPLVGRWIDANGSRSLMSFGTLIGIAGLTMWATAHTVAVFYAAFVLIGFAMATTLYPPAFATVVRSHPDQSRRAIVTITLAGGLASTIFSPLAQVLSEQGSWRTSLGILIVGYAAFTLPVNLSLPTARAEIADTNPAASGNRDTAPAQSGHARPKALWVLAAIFTLSSGVSSAFAVHIVAFLIESGQAATAAASIAGAAGLGKVAGRALLAAGSRYSPTALLRGCLAVQAGFLAMPVVWGHVTGAVLMVVMFGATSGALTIIRPLLVADLVGTAHFATRNGEIQLVTTLTKATMPVAVGAAVAGSSYEVTWLGLAGVVVGAALITRTLDTARISGGPAADLAHSDQEATV